MRIDFPPRPPSPRGAARRRAASAFLAGAAVGAAGGLIGLGGAEFRLPLLAAVFGYAMRDPIGLNVALSFVTVVFSLACRVTGDAAAALWPYAFAALTLAAGTIAGASVGAAIGHRLSTVALTRVVAVLLLVLAAVMASHAAGADQPLRLALPTIALALASFGAGVAIGAVASLLGVAGGELLIPTLVLLYPIDTKLAGTLSLAISTPTLITSLLRWRQVRGDWSLWYANRALLAWMGAGTIAGAAGGARLLGAVDARVVILLLAALLVYSALHLAWQARPRR